MHFFVVHTIISVLIKKQSQGIPRPGDGLEDWQCLPKAKLPPKEYKVRAVIFYWGTRPKARTHLDYPLCSPATDVRLEGVKCQAGWVRSLCNTPSNTDVRMQRCQDHQLNWSPAKSRGSPVSLTPTPLCILLLCFTHTAQPRQQKAIAELKAKIVCRVPFHSEP